MKNKAIGKITDEMMEINTPLAVGVEEYLTEKCRDDETAEKILNPLKTLKEICEQITEKARQDAKNGVACLPDAEVLKMVDEYYELNTEKAKPVKINVMDLL